MSIVYLTVLFFENSDTPNSAAATTEQREIDGSTMLLSLCCEKYSKSRHNETAHFNQIVLQLKA